MRDMANDKSSAEAFGRRLRQLMRAKGYVSDTSRSKVDVTALADAAGTSYEMARRYADGLATPRADTMQKIATWLGVAPAVLAWGGSDESSVDEEVLQKCISGMIEAQIRTGITLDAERAARLVAMLYLEEVDGRSPASATVDRMLKAVS